MMGISIYSTGKEFIIKFSPKVNDISISDPLGNTTETTFRNDKNVLNRAARSNSGASHTGSEGSTVLSGLLFAGDLKEMQLYADDANVSCCTSLHE